MLLRLKLVEILEKQESLDFYELDQSQSSRIFLCSQEPLFAKPKKKKSLKF